MGIDTLSAIAAAAEHPVPQRVQRLVYAAAVGPQADRAIAQSAAMEAVAAGVNIRLHDELARRYALPPNNDFVVRQKAANDEVLEGLQKRLGEAQHSMIRESERAAHCALAEYYGTHGDTQTMTKMLAKASGGNTKPEHTAEICLVAVRGFLFANADPRYPALETYLQRAETVINHVDDDTYLQLRVANAVAKANAGQFRQVATLLSTNLRLKRKGQQPTGPPDLAKAASPFMLLKDWALLATLSALVAYDRPELEQFLATPEIKLCLEDAPELASTARAFFECHYATALKALVDMGPAISANPFIGKHCHTILQRIKDKALRQYVAPFMTLKLAAMADVFHMPVAEIEQSVGRLIVRGEISARIDKTNMMLRATQVDKRVEALAHAAALADDFVHDAEAALRVLSMQRNGVAVESRRNDARAKLHAQMHGRV